MTLPSANLRHLAIPAVALLAVVSSSCASRTFNNDEAEIKEAPPSNTERLVRCDLAPLPPSAKKAKFNERSVEYFTSDEIGYERADWFAAGKPWMSFDALNSGMLGNPGFEGDSRNFVGPGDTNVRVVAIDVRNIGGNLAYHYFSNETATSPMENWSSTKALAMLQAAHSIRMQTGGTHGFLSTVFGGSPSGAWIGTHVTEVARTSDNGVAAWFKSITGLQGSQNFVRNWLGSEGTFGGWHGTGPTGLGNRVKANNAGPEKTLGNAGRNEKTVSENTLMPIIMAEFWKRLGANTADKVTWLKRADYAGPVKSASERKSSFFDPSAPSALTDDDLKVLLYGFVESSSNGGLSLGATQHDEFVRAFGGKGKLDSLSGGRWRLFGKTGSGSAGVSARKRNEAVFGGVFCLPANPSRPFAKEGRMVAFFINAMTKGSAGEVRQKALQGVANAMIPDLNGAKDLWGAAAAPAEGTASAKVGTVIKRKPLDSTSPELSADEKCAFPKDGVLEYKSRSAADNGHTKLTLKSVNPTCPKLVGEVFVFSGHFDFKDKE